MSITMDNTTLKKIYYDGTEVKKAYYDGVLVFSGWDGNIMGNPDFTDKWVAVCSSTNRYGVVANDSYVKVFSYDSDIPNSTVRSWGDPDLYVSMEGDGDPTDDDGYWGTHVYAYLPVDLTDCLTVNVYGEAVQVGPYYCGCAVWISNSASTSAPDTFDWTSGGGTPPKYGMVSINVAHLTGVHYICVSKGHWEGYAKITQLFLTMNGEKNGIGGIGRLGFLSGDDNMAATIDAWRDLNEDIVTYNSGVLTFKRACRIKISYNMSGHQNNQYCGTQGFIKINGVNTVGIGGGLWHGDRSLSDVLEVDMAEGDTLQYYARLDRYDNDEESFIAASICITYLT